MAMMTARVEIFEHLGGGHGASPLCGEMLGKHDLCAVFEKEIQVRCGLSDTSCATLGEFTLDCTEIRIRDKCMTVHTERLPSEDVEGF